MCIVIIYCQIGEFGDQFPLQNDWIPGITLLTELKEKPERFNSLKHFIHAQLTSLTAAD